MEKSLHLQLIWLSASDEQRNEMHCVLEEVHILIHHAVHDQESVGPVKRVQHGLHNGATRKVLMLESPKVLLTEDLS